MTINEALNSVSKPTRYVGNEWNSVHRNDRRLTMDDGRVVRVALAFPDLYEIGMSHLGLNILYGLLNGIEGVTAERVYLPGADMQRKIRAGGIALFSLETHTPISEFDIIGFSLQYELSYPGVLAMLDLAGIPLRSEDRGNTHPLIIAGGACAFNPEPLADFIDAFVIGEAEEALLEIIQKLKAQSFPLRQGFGGQAKVKGQDLLKELAKIEGVYVPELYEVRYKANNAVDSIKPKYEGVPAKIKKRFIKDLDSVFYPEKPVVPFQSIVHDRAVIEIFRGCAQGCRFCHAGMTSRPVRLRSAGRIAEIAGRLMENTGWEEISLLALNVCDHPDIQGIVSDIAQKYGRTGTSISLPSLRPDNFSMRLARLVSMGARAKPTMTFAAEAGTQRLRNSINKGVTEEGLASSIRNIFGAGWDSCKLYFMIGLPGETDEDIRGIVSLAKELRANGQRIDRNAAIRLGVSSFVPKPHTPFQWEPQDSIASLEEKQRLVFNSLKRMEVRWSNPGSSFLEGVLARGDRRLGKALVHAMEAAKQNSDPEEEPVFALWEGAFQKAGIDPAFYIYRKRDYSEILPWDHIDAGVSREFLVSESMKSKEGIMTPSCASGDCGGCGACDRKSIQHPVSSIQQPTENIKDKLDTGHWTLATEVKQRIRIEFSKGEELKYISHLDLQRVLLRAMRRSEMPLAFSRSYHPHPEIMPGLPLSVGMTSECELCDVILSERMELGEFSKRLCAQLPEGLRLKKAEDIMVSAPALPNSIKGVKYEVNCKLKIVPKGSLRDKLENEIQEFLKKEEIMVRRKTPKADKTINIRPLIGSVEYEGDGDLFTLLVSLKVGAGSSARPDEVAGALVPGSEILGIKRTAIVL